MNPRNKTRRRRVAHETTLLIYALVAGFPAVGCALTVLWFSEYRFETALTWTILIVPAWLGFSFAVRARATHALRILSNILTGMREGDYSVRARRGTRHGALSELSQEINSLSITLQRQRLSEIEIAALLTTVMREIDVAIFAFDSDHRLRLANQSAQVLMDRTNDELIGATAEDLGLSECLSGPSSRLLDRTFPGGNGRWGMRRSQFHERGRPHDLIVITDLTRTLREEELLAWQRLVRVLGHEMNNSLAAIKSIAGSLNDVLGREVRPSDWEADLSQGLEIIESRSENLSRFMQGYTQLARLPKPQRGPCDVRTLMERVARLEHRVPVRIRSAEDSTTIRADGAQLEQVLINLIKNAAEAILAGESTGGEVTLTWELRPPEIVLKVMDNGPGMPASANLFVPFFTTKEHGTGIGLVLSRQIAENHGGSLNLENRQGGRGCTASVRLPL